MGICRFCQNFPVKCPCSETFELCEIKQQQKTKTKNKKKKQKTKPKKKGTRVPCKISHIAQFSKNRVSKQRRFAR